MVQNKKQLFRFAVDNFVLILEQIRKKKVNYKCNDVDVSSFNVFYETYKEKISTDFIKNFLQYNIQNYFNDDNYDFSKKIRFSWIFGKKGIERWEKNKTSTNIYFVRKNLKKKYKINLSKKSSNLSQIITRVRLIEENFKKEFHNTKRGFLWCVANTTLYFHKSSFCATCIHKKECKELLEQEYKSIYIKRGYEK